MLSQLLLRFLGAKVHFFHEITKSSAENIISCQFFLDYSVMCP